MAYIFVLELLLLLSKTDSERSRIVDIDWSSQKFVHSGPTYVIITLTVVTTTQNGVRGRQSSLCAWNIISICHRDHEG